MIKLTQLLNEALTEREKQLGNVAFGDPLNKPEIAKLQGAEPGSEKNTPEERELLVAFQDWVLDPEEGEQSLSPFLKDFPSLAKEYPNIFKASTPLGGRVYRGVTKLNVDILYQLQQSKEEDWREFSYKNQKFYLYNKPVRYEPRRKVQSWTSSKDVAFRFKGDAIFVTNQDDHFFMNQEFFNIIFHHDEKEILHIGRSYKNEVYVIVTDAIFNSRIRPMI